MSRSERILPWAICFALLGVVLAIAGKNMVVALDLFHEMALYRQMEQEGQTPMEDAFAYTPTVVPVVHHEWATGAVLYLATVTAGWGAPGLVAIKYFLTFSVCIGCFVLAKRNGASLAVFAILTPVALNVGGWMAFTNIRAQLFTLFFYVAMLFMIDADKRGKRWWIAVWIPMFILWANMHAGFLAGFGILALYGVSRLIESYLETKSPAATLKRVAHLLLVGIGSIVLLNVNPYGWEYTPYLLRAVTMDRPLIVEWRSIWELGSFQPMLHYIVSAVIALYAIWQSGRTRLFESMALLLTAYLAMKNYRHGSLYAVTWACFVPAMIDLSVIGESVKGLWKRYTPQLAVVGLAIGIVATGFSINNRFWELRVPGTKRTPTEGVLIYPVGAVNYLADNSFNGNVFVPFASGAFVSWKLYPQVKVSMDSRYEVAYPHGAIEENVGFYQGLEGWKDTLAKYDTDAILVPNRTGIAQVLGAEQSVVPWQCVYRDLEFSLYVPSENASGFPVVDRKNERIVGVFP